MYLAAWALIGLLSGWLARRFLAEDGYHPMVNNLVAVVGAVGGGLILRVAEPAMGYGLNHSGVAAILGAMVLTGITTFIVGRGWLV